MELVSLNCSDTVGWATGGASCLYKAGCWFVSGDDLTMMWGGVSLNNYSKIYLLHLR